ncbi:MAG: NUDIX domain-containing protein, partial [Anaerolineae bacterium]
MDKPNAERLGWRLRHTHRPFANRYFQVRQDELIRPDGERQSYSYVEFSPVVVVVPVTVQREIVLIRQFRYTIDDWIWEVPAGGSHDFDGDDLEILVRRELREEIGGRTGKVTWMGHFNPLIGKADVVFIIYLATEVELG